MDAAHAAAAEAERRATIAERLTRETVARGPMVEAMAPVPVDELAAMLTAALRAGRRP